MNADTRRVVKKQQQKIELELQLRDATLCLSLLDWEEMTAGTLHIDQGYINSHSDMRSFFPTPQNLMYTLAELFPTLPHARHSITLQFSLNAAKINVHKEYLLELRQDEARQHQMLKSQLRDIKMQREQEVKHMEGMLSELKQKLKQQINKREQSQEEVKRLAAQLKQSNARRVSLISDNDKIKEQIGSELSQLKQELQRDSKALQQARETITDRELKLQALESMVEERQRVDQRRWRCIREDSPHLMCFYASHGMQEVTFTKQSENGWAHVILDWSIPAGAVAEVDVTTAVMRDGSMGLGVGTDAVMGSTTYKHPALLTYFFRDGTVTSPATVLTQTHRRIQHNFIVILRVDRVNNTAAWLTGEEEVIGEAGLGGLARSEMLYFVLTMFWKGDAMRVTL